MYRVLLENTWMFKQAVCFQETKVSSNIFKLFKVSKIILKLVDTPFFCTCTGNVLVLMIFRFVS